MAGLLAGLAVTQRPFPRGRQSRAALALGLLLAPTTPLRVARRGIAVGDAEILRHRPALVLGESFRGEAPFAERCALPARQALAMGLIVGELVTNSVKYAHPAGVRGLISVACRRSKAGGIEIEVSDDGVGLPEDFAPDDSQCLGMTLIRGLAGQLRARLTYLASDVGLTVRLAAPA